MTPLAVAATLMSYFLSVVDFLTSLGIYQLIFGGKCRMTPNEKLRPTSKAQGETRYDGG